MSPVEDVKQSRGDAEFQILRLLSSVREWRADSNGALPAALSRSNVDRLLERLAEQRLTALVGSRALPLAGPAARSALEPPVSAALAFNRARGLALEALATRVAGRLEDAAIPVLVLKGPFMARRLHGDIGMRMVNDLDLLVEPRHLAAARSVLAGLGFVSASPEGESHDLHHTFEDPDGTLPRIDLHWRVHWYEESFSTAMLKRSTPSADGVREPDPEDDLAALLLYYARDGFFGLRAPADIAAWWDVHGEAAGDEPVLARTWADHPRLRRPLLAACAVAESTVGVPARGLLPATDGGGRRERLASRLANPAQAGDLDQLAANVELVDALLGPADQLGEFAHRNVLLEPGQIARVYELRRTGRLRLQLLRWLHVPKVLARYALGLWGARRPA